MFEGLALKSKFLFGRWESDFKTYKFKKLQNLRKTLKLYRTIAWCLALLLQYILFCILYFRIKTLSLSQIFCPWLQILEKTCAKRKMLLSSTSRYSSRYFSNNKAFSKLLEYSIRPKSIDNFLDSLPAVIWKVFLSILRLGLWHDNITRLSRCFPFY